MFGFRKKAKEEKPAVEVKPEVAEVQEAPEPEKEAPKKNVHAEAVAKAAGWDYEEALEKMKAARAAFGITLGDYSKHAFHKLSEEEQQKKAEEILAKREKVRAQKQADIETVAAAAGWSKEQAEAEMDKVKKALGTTFRDYAKFSFYELNEEQQKEKYAQILAKREEKKKEKEAAAKVGPDPTFGAKIASITNDGIEFYWKKVEVASGYEVFRSYSRNGEYELIFTANKRNIGTYVDSEFDHSQKSIFYTARSFLKTESGEILYSDKIEPAEAQYHDRMSVERTCTYIYSGDTRTIYAIYGWGEPEDGIWSSSDESVATVENGVITGVARGECTITFTSASAGQSVDSKVVVDRQAVEPIGSLTGRFQKVDGIWKNPDAKETGSALIMMVGDMMCGAAQMKRQYSEGEGWNFNDSYEHTRKMTAEADFAVGNLETLLAPGWPYMADEVFINNYNNCNAPSRYLDAVRYGGFDSVMMANNHNCDGGLRALIETVEQVDRYHFPRTGAFLDPEDQRFFIADINGIKVGYLAYMTKATGFNGKENSWSAEEQETHLNIFNKEKAVKDVEALKAAGAEYIIAYMHWGGKNFRKLTASQLRDAKDVADAGADYIVGANPHVLQEYDVIQAEDGREVPCYYSTGNFQAVMNQIPGNRDSVIVRIRLNKKADGTIELAENAYIPCYAYPKIGGCNWAPTSVSENYSKGLLKKDRAKILKRIKTTIGSKVEAL